MEGESQSSGVDQHMKDTILERRFRKRGFAPSSGKSRWRAVPDYHRRWHLQRGLRQGQDRRAVGPERQLRALHHHWSGSLNQFAPPWDAIQKANISFDLSTKIDEGKVFDNNMFDAVQKKNAFKMSYDERNSPKGVSWDGEVEKILLTKKRFRCNIQINKSLTKFARRRKSGFAFPNAGSLPEVRLC
jgi:hypothetical protein